MARPKTAAGSDRRAPLELGGSTIQAGTHEHIEIPVARLPTGTWLPLPVSVVHGIKPGPMIWLSAAVHGDELNGIPIIREVVHNLAPERVAGTVVAVPIVNAFGLINESRYLPDRRDLNRSFPGSKRGSLASQLAFLFMEQVVKRCEFGIDFHTGSQGRTNLPQIRCDAYDEGLRRLAEVFAPPVIVHARMRSGSLRTAAAKLGIPTLLYEAGQDTRFDRQAIEMGIAGVFRVLHYLGMIDESPAPPQTPPQLSYRTTWARAKRSGMCQMKVRLGDRVKKGETVAVVFDTVTNADTRIKSPTSGVIIGRLTRALVNRGEAIAHVAEISE